MKTSILPITVEPITSSPLTPGVVMPNSLTITFEQTLDLGGFNLAAQSVVIHGMLTGTGSVSAPVSGNGTIDLGNGNTSIGGLNSSCGFNFKANELNPPVPRKITPSVGPLRL